MKKIGEITKKEWIKAGIYLALYILFLIWVRSWMGIILIPFIFDALTTHIIKWKWWKNVKNKSLYQIMDWVDAIVFALVAVYFVNIYLFQNYAIPSSSLEKSLLVGDHLYVSKVAYGPRKPMTPLTMPLTQNQFPGGTKSYFEKPQWPYERIKGFGKIKLNEIVVFNYPSGDTLVSNPKWSSADYYGMIVYPLGKSKCKLDAHRINIDCFLKYSASSSEKGELLEYYDLLRQVKISQHCCKLLKKEPSERVQAELGVDVIFKGLMAAESRSRMTSFCTRGELFAGRHRDHLPAEDPFWHCNPLGIWTDDDIWEYIRRYDVPYSSLYDRTWKSRDGKLKKVKRNGCFGCATGIAFADNQMAVLRQIEPRIWERVMRAGMAEQLQNLRIARANGQLSFMDLYDADTLLDIRPCIFDSVDELILKDNVATEYDAEEE